jgi:hypothetical protein
VDLVRLLPWSRFIWDLPPFGGGETSAFLGRSEKNRLFVVLAGQVLDCLLDEVMVEFVDVHWLSNILE